MTFTKEQLIEQAHARIEFAKMMLADEPEPLKERTWSIELELALIALASLEAEPVAWRYRTTDIKGNPKPGWSFSEEASLLGLYQPLYAATPAPVSVPEIDRKVIADRVHSKCSRIPGATFYNAAELALDEVESCRADLLQGKE